MLMLLATFVICGGAWYYVWRKYKADEAARDAQFRATMLALEEKAKREGTYVGSYFDDWSKPKT